MPLFRRSQAAATAAAWALGPWRRRPTFCSSSSFSVSASAADDQTAKPLPRKRRAAGDADAMGFADSCQVRCSGGKGGDGLIAFNRLFCNPMAGPGGGDGGHGGHVILRCDEIERDLSRVPIEVRAESGRGGGSFNCHGRCGEHLTITVPPGTQVLDERGNQLYELQTHGEVYVAARGGAGGKGNAFFLSNANRAPQLAEYGAAGESRLLSLRLRVLADAGLVGFPNAGKSSLLRAISRARPRVSPYPFTTLQPHIGVVSFPNMEVTVADIPGLVDGAHENRGLGHDFLRHIVRCPCLICVIDLGASDPIGQLETLRSELDLFSPNMSAAVRLIVGNKSDLSYSETNLRLLRSAAASDAEGGIDWRPLPPIMSLSAKTGENVAKLTTFLHTYFRSKSFV